MTETREERLRRRLVALTRDLVLIPSVPGRPEDCRRCFELVRNRLDGLDAIDVQEFTSRGFTSLVARPRGVAEPDVLLCGHLDVITHPDIGFYGSEIRDGRIIGPGAGDMKGALAILLELFRATHMRAAGVSLGLAVTSDEELGGENGTGYLVNSCGLRARAVIIPDGGSLGRITAEEKGILHVAVRCSGRPAHAARPWRGRNAIEAMLAALGRLRERFATWSPAPGNDAAAAATAASGEGDDAHWHPTCAVTVIGTENATVNRIPADATAVLDIRFPRPHTVASMLELVQGTLAPEATAEPIVSAEATHLDPDPVYLEATQEVLGVAPEIGRDSGGSDARFFNAHGIPVLMSRPLVGRLHAADEWIDIESMVRYHRICERYLERRLGVEVES